MFFWGKEETENEEIFKVKNLFVGSLGYVTETNNGWHIEPKKKFILFKKEKFDSLDYCGENIFTNQTYFFFYGNTCLYNTVNKAVNSYAIYNSIPLEQFIDEPKMEISKGELLELYYKINKISLKDNKTEKEEQIKDNILKMILQTSDIVKEAEIDFELKKDIIKELDELGEYYVNSMLGLLHQEQKVLALGIESEYSIGMECIKRLVEIESKFKDSKMAKSYSLKRQFGQFRKNLNQNNDE